MIKLRTLNYNDGCPVKLLPEKIFRKNKIFKTEMAKKYQMKHAKKAAANWRLVITIIILSGLAIVFLLYFYFPLIYEFIDNKVLGFFSENTLLVEDENGIEDDYSGTIIEEIPGQHDCIMNSEVKIAWPGLGMMISQMGTDEEYDFWIDKLMAQGFTEFREVPSYQTWQWVDQSKASLLRNIPKGAKYIWGVSSNSFDNPDYVITAGNWPEFRQSILDAAQWAQDNDVYEFQIGNEEEYHIDGTTMTVDQIIASLKSVATEAQEIFTTGNISYSCGHDHISKWVAAGKGDIDLLASNVYMGHNNSKTGQWKEEIDALISGFGPSGTYITEFSLNSNSLSTYSGDEKEQAAGIYDMIEYIKASGIKRAIFFCLKGDRFGIIKSDGTCRSLIWDALTISEVSKIE